MKHPTASRVGARLVAGLGLLVSAALYLLVAGQVDGASGAQLGMDISISEGAIMRSVAVIEAAAGVWVLAQPTSRSGLAAAGVAGVALWLSPRTDTAALLDLGLFAVDARYLVHAIEVAVVVAGLAVVASSVSRVLAERRTAGRA